MTIIYINKKLDDSKYWESRNIFLKPTTDGKVTM